MPESPRFAGVFSGKDALTEGSCLHEKQNADLAESLKYSN